LRSLCDLALSSDVGHDHLEPKFPQLLAEPDRANASLPRVEALFQTLETRQLEDWIRSEPTSIFGRRASYLYELLTGRTLDIPDVIPSGYIDLLDPEIHLTGPRRLVRRQRINHNLLGFGGYSPLVRRTDTLKAYMAEDLAAEASAIIKSCDPVAYDQVLERFSASIMPLIRYDLDPARGMTVHNDTVSLYRYFDATPEADIPLSLYRGDYPARSARRDRIYGRI